MRLMIDVCRRALKELRMQRPKPSKQCKIRRFICSRRCLDLCDPEILREDQRVSTDDFNFNNNFWMTIMVRQSDQRLALKKFNFYFV